MITFNDEPVKASHFPDGTQYIDFSNLVFIDSRGADRIGWYYDSDEELFVLASLVNWARRNRDRMQALVLDMPYVPNARMDRVKYTSDNFALKVFADFINSLNFDAVYVENVHSNVSEALINNVKNRLPEEQVHKALKYNPDVIFFPDEGACKRYSDLAAVIDSDAEIAFGIKKRDFRTGKILGLDVIADTDLTGKNVLIIDDICSAGGTFKHSAIKLKEMGAADVALYVTHCEDNIKNGDLLKTDLISTIFTTDSILHIDDPKFRFVHTYRPSVK